jgi:hypothetical protein
MANITIEKIRQLPKGFQESIIERSQIKAAISNANQFKTYARYCAKKHKEYPGQSWDIVGANSLMPYYEKLLSVEELANKYKELWGENFYKCKLQCEKILSI